MKKMDIHSHLIKKEKEYQLKELLADMERFNIYKRVISTFDGDSIQVGNQDIADIVDHYPNKFIGCALINPALPTFEEDLKHALSLKQIKMIELNSFEHGYYPDSHKNIKNMFDEINKHKDMIVKVFTGLGAKSLPHQWEIWAKEYPNIRFVFLHMGCFDYGYDCIEIAKRNENIYLETSNQYELQILKKAFNHLSLNKIIFGTTYPERFTRSGIEIFDLYHLKEEDLSKIMYQNMERLLK